MTAARLLDMYTFLADPALIIRKFATRHAHDLRWRQP